MSNVISIDTARYGSLKVSPAFIVTLHNAGSSRELLRRLSRDVTPSALYAAVWKREINSEGAMVIHALWREDERWPVRLMRWVFGRRA